MGDEFVIPDLSDGAIALTHRMNREPKNQGGIPQTRIESRDRRYLEEIDNWLRQLANHLPDLFRRAEVTQRGGYLSTLPEHNDPWEQRTLMLRVRRMSAKGVGSTKYPHDPAQVLFLNDLVEFLKDIVREHKENTFTPGDAGEDNGTPFTVSERMDNLELAIGQVEDEVVPLKQAVDQILAHLDIKILQT